MKKNFLSEQVINTCRTKLLDMKSMLLNQIKNMAAEFNTLDKSRGDESDLSAAHQEEHNFLTSQYRAKMQLVEIDLALARIENGHFGICEETEETIETERLLAIPWTRLSIEGAEIREALVRKSGKNFSTSL
ncbi:MAG: TraR/DksA family transcriptional regulator [Pseudobdellovibrio sp.]